MEREGENEASRQTRDGETGDTASPSRAAVSPRVETEAESEKMHSLGQLAAGVAHDFNNSLAAILGRTQLLLRTVSDERQRSNLEVIETAALDAAEIVRRIQTFARRTPSGPPSALSLSKLINDAIQLTRSRWESDAHARGIQYEMECASCEEGDDLIAANPSEVREVLVNLILNALDAMPRGGRLHFNPGKADSFVVLAVEDTGEGIAPENVSRIFEPFFTTKGAHGSGLGLAVTRGIIHRYGGTINVESKVGHGTTFTLRFPRAVVVGPSRAVPSDGLPRCRVLVVDDDETVREVLVEFLRELELEVTETSRPHAALVHLADGGFDLLITDLSMPSMDGLSLAAEARKLSPALRTVLTTGYGQQLPGNHQAERSVIDAVIGKPFRLSDLEATLRTLLADII